MVFLILILHGSAALIHIKRISMALNAIHYILHCKKKYYSMIGICFTNAILAFLFQIFSFNSDFYEQLKSKVKLVSTPTSVYQSKK